jgi:hypothetical protein
LLPNRPFEKNEDPKSKGYQERRAEAKKKAKEGLSKYYSLLGFKWETDDFMTRLSAYKHPSLKEVMFPQQI